MDGEDELRILAHNNARKHKARNQLVSYLVDLSFTPIVPPMSDAMVPKRGQILQASMMTDDNEHSMEIELWVDLGLSVLGSSTWKWRLRLEYFAVNVGRPPLV
jgi:hypothetical protein